MNNKIKYGIWYIISYTATINGLIDVFIIEIHSS
jgi:hypothetical protein